MKKAYKIALIKEEEGYTVYIPAFDGWTQGKDLEDALYMAGDYIGIMGIELEDSGKTIPQDVPYTIKDGEEGSYLVVDFTEYRRKNETRTVKKNCTIPSWLCYEGEKAGINFSAVLQAALKKELKISDR